MAEKAEAGTETVSEVPTHQRDGTVSVALANYKIGHKDIAVRDLRELVLRRGTSHLLCSIGCGIEAPVVSCNPGILE
jgi:hypothetical protein